MRSGSLWDATASGAHCVGRDDERALLAQWVREGGAVIHLCGSGGLGKSTLARAFGADHVRAGGRVVVVERPTARKLEGLLRGVLAAFGSPTDVDADVALLEERLARKLAEQENTVVLLDGVDASRTAVKALVDRWRDERWLGALLIVSRGSDVGAPDHRLRLRPLDADGALACARAHAGFEASRTGQAMDGLERVARACAGHPLAIQLAAARLRTHSAADVVAWVRRRGHASRQVRAAIGELYAELVDADRRALMTLAALGAPPALALAEHLFAAEGCDASLPALRAAGIAWSRRSAHARNGDEHVWVHDTLLHVAERDLRTPPYATLCERVRERVVTYGESLVDEFGRPRSREALALLKSIAPQLEAILERAKPDAIWARAALLVNCALDVALSRRRALLLSRALERSYDPHLELRLRLARARAVVPHNDLDTAARDVEAARTVAASLGSRAGLILASHVDTLCRVHRGEVSSGRTQARRTIELAEGFDVGFACEARIFLAFAALLQGDYEDAATEAGLALTLAHETHDDRLVAYAAQHRAAIHLDALELDDAERLALISVRAARRARNDLFAGIALRLLGGIELARGHSARATRLLRRAEGVFRRIDNTRARAHTLVYLGAALLAEGETPTGIDTLREALGAGIARHHAVIALSFLAFAQWRQGDTETARQTIAEARSKLDVDAGFVRATADWVDDVVHGRSAANTARRGVEVAVLERLQCAPLPANARVTMRRHVALSGAWFVAYDGQIVSLARRPALARILASLAASAVAGGAPVPAIALHDASWPGQRATEAIALNRVRVSIWALRRLGLPGIESSRDGYWLEGVHVVAAEAEVAPPAAGTAYRAGRAHDHAHAALRHGLEATRS